MRKRRDLFDRLFKDHFFRNIFVGIGVIFVWRGAWNLMDLYFFPLSPLWGNIGAIVLGIIIIYLPNRSLHELGEYERKVIKKLKEPLSK